MIRCIYCDEFQAVGPAGTCDHCEPMPDAPRDQRGPEPMGEPAVSIVYRITHLPTGRLYVGKHKPPEGWTDPFEDDGYQGGGDAIEAAVNKHGWAAFRKDVLAVLPTEESALELEAGLVGPEQVASPMYFNLCLGGGEVLGLDEEAEARRLERLREAMRNATPEQRAVWRAAKATGLRAVTQTEEWREANAEKNRELARDPAWKAKNLEAVRRPETRVRKRAGLRRYFDNETPEARDARIEKTKEAARHDKTRAKKSAANFRRYANETPEERAARVEQLTERMRALARTEEWREAHAARCRTPEARAKTSAAQRKLCEDPAELEKRSAVQLKRYANETPERKEARCRAISEGCRRAKAERERVKREVALIVLALVAAAAR